MHTRSTGHGWLLLTLAFAASLVVNAMLFPPFRAPDERAHVDMSRQVAQRVPAGGVVHGPDEVRHIDERVRAAGVLTGLTGPPAGLPPLAAGDAPPRAQRPPFAELGPAQDSPLRNQMTQHPPAYYLLTGLSSRWLEATPAREVPFDRQVVLLRLLSAALVGLLPAAAALTARRLGGDAVAAGVAALLPLGVPMLGHMGAAVNNDALLVFAVAAATPLLVGAASGRRSWPATVAVAGLGGLALLAKGFGLLVLPWIVIAYAAGAGRHARVLPAVLHGAVAAGGAFALGGWWWVRNLLVLGEVQPHHAQLPSAGEGVSPDWAWWALFAARRFVQRFWFEPDTVQEAAPWEYAATAGLLVLVCAGLVVAGRRAGAGPALVAVSPLLAATVMVAVGAAGLYQETGGPFGIHGRYTYPGLAGLFAVAGLGVVGGRRRWIGVALVAAAVAALLAWGWVAALGFYWGVPGGGLGASLRALLAWSPLPPAVVLGAALATWGLLAAGVAQILCAARLRTGAPAVPPRAPARGRRRAGGIRRAGRGR